ncbi:hypothetical protein ABIC09_001309 [Bradyrhizobium sp. S3.12.5]
MSSLDMGAMIRFSTMPRELRPAPDFALFRGDFLGLRAGVKAATM